jgi:hypothetical protein
MKLKSNFIESVHPRKIFDTRHKILISVRSSTFILNTFRSVTKLGIATGYGLDDRMIGVRFPAEAGNFSPRHRVQTASGAHPASYPMGAGGSFPGGKAAGA